MRKLCFPEATGRHPRIASRASSPVRLFGIRLKRLPHMALERQVSQRPTGRRTSGPGERLGDSALVGHPASLRGKFMMDRRRNIAFVHIQKTGGSSIARALGLKDDPPEKHFSARELREFYGAPTWNACFRFAFVRNPWDRLVSWWSMIDGHRPRWRAGARLNAFQRFVLSKAVTFEDFLTKCDQDFQDADGFKWIFRNQIDYLVDDEGKLMVEEIGRFERLQDDFNAILTRAGGRASWLRRRFVDFGPKSLPRVNSTDHRPYETYYTSMLRDLVAERYREDIEAFDYSFGRR
jgi:hypothetical protein